MALAASDSAPAQRSNPSACASVRTVSELGNKVSLIIKDLRGQIVSDGYQGSVGSKSVFKKAHAIGSLFAVDKRLRSTQREC
jgi:hypothetical protein